MLTNITTVISHAALIDAAIFNSAGFQLRNARFQFLDFLLHRQDLVHYKLPDIADEFDLFVRLHAQAPGESAAPEMTPTARVFNRSAPQNRVAFIATQFICHVETKPLDAVGGESGAVSN